MTSQFISYFSRRAEAISLALRTSPPPSPSQESGRVTARTGRAGAGEGVVGARKRGSLGKLWTGEPERDCTFCEIVSGVQDCWKIYEDDDCLAFLDILPIRPGHLLVIPKRHFPKVSDLPDEVSASIGRCVPRIARALCRAMDQYDFNIVSNQGYAQIVHHVHYHLVPAPTASKPIRSGWASLVGREELDEDEAAVIVAKVKQELQDDAKSGGHGGPGKAKL
ncbi:HIT-like protein [Meredithblackwellia eburnea MCA 4105]